MQPNPRITVNRGPAPSASGAYVCTAPAGADIEPLQAWIVHAPESRAAPLECYLLEHCPAFRYVVPHSEHSRPDEAAADLL